MIDSDDIFLSVAEVAARWRCSLRLVYLMIERHDLGSTRVGSLIRVRLSDVVAYEARHTHPATSQV